MLSFTEMAVTEEEAQAYATSRGLADWYYDAAALRRGQDFIAARYNGSWKCEWENDDAPDVVKYAIVEAALYELTNPGGLTPTVDLTARVKRERKKVDVIEKEVEYASTAMTADASRPVLTKIGDLLSSELVGSGSSLVGYAMRA